MSDVTDPNDAAKVMHWLSYGAGVNSTALLVALIEKKVDAHPFRVVFSDTQDERDETYDYLYHQAMPYARKHGVTIEVCRGYEGVLERWERLSVTGNRIMRTCTKEAKTTPIGKHIRAHTHKEQAIVQLIGIHADEQHRARPANLGESEKRYPLIELGWGPEECREAIERAGLPIPVKSGCWHCPFLRKQQVIDLCISAPCKFDRIIRLEDAANAKHPGDTVRTQWGDKPAREWRDGGSLFADASKDLPCGCMDE